MRFGLWGNKLFCDLLPVPRAPGSGPAAAAGAVRGERRLPGSGTGERVRYCRERACGNRRAPGDGSEPGEPCRRKMPENGYFCHQAGSGRLRARALDNVEFLAISAVGRGHPAAPVLRKGRPAGAPVRAGSSRQKSGGMPCSFRFRRPAARVNPGGILPDCNLHRSPQAADLGIRERR